MVVGATADPNNELKVNTNGHLTKGAKLLGCTLGDSETLEVRDQRFPET